MVLGSNPDCLQIVLLRSLHNTRLRGTRSPQTQKNLSYYITWNAAIHPRNSSERDDGDPSHIGIEGNERADQIAKEATSLGWSAPISTSRANAIRRAKMAAKKEWTHHWKTTPKTGGFAIANNIHPSLKPTKRFLNTPREVFGRPVQCRTGHAYTGEFRRRFAPGEPVDCQCGEEFQTRKHILISCNRFNPHRKHLRKESRDIALPVILGTEKGIAALAMFLKTSGAFTRLGHTQDKRPLPIFEDEPEPAESDTEDEDEHP